HTTVLVINLFQTLQCLALSSLLVISLLVGCYKKKEKALASPTAIAADKAANAPKGSSIEPVNKTPNPPSSGGGATSKQPPSSEEKKDSEKKAEKKKEHKEDKDEKK
ncbi:hypothetical protein PENTCL1PPCAC_2809, partial [Pristionchus entomophagus]